MEQPNYGPETRDCRSWRARPGNPAGTLPIVGDRRTDGSAGRGDRRAARGPALIALFPPGAARPCRADRAASPEPAADLFGRVWRNECAVGLPHRKLLRT